MRSCRAPQLTGVAQPARPLRPEQSGYIKLPERHNDPSIRTGGDVLSGSPTDPGTCGSRYVRHPEVPRALGSLR